MSTKETAITYSFKNLNKISNGYAGFSFETASSLMHYHKDFYELTLITEGHWQHTIHTATTSLVPNTLLLFKPGITHLLNANTPQSSHFVFCVEKNFFENRMRQLFPNFDLVHMPEFLIKPISSEKRKYIEYLGNILCHNPKLSNIYGDELFFLCLSDFAHAKDTLDYSEHITDIIQKLNNYMYLNTSVKEICEKYPFSQAVLLRQFKKATGMTIVQYKAKQKMQYACELLTQTNCSLLEISSFLQYDSLSYFLQTFKKTYGITPSEYRKKHSKR